MECIAARVDLDPLHPHEVVATEGESGAEQRWRQLGGSVVGRVSGGRRGGGRPVLLEHAARQLEL